MIDTRTEPYALEQRARALPRLCHGHAADQQRHRHVFQRGEFRQQVVELIDEAERAIAQLAAHRVGQLVDLLTGDRHRSRRRQIEAAEQLQ